jgi:hypothetical protein
VIDTLNDPARRNEGRFFGKYRGKVTDNKDPLSLGRIQALVPGVFGMVTNWALPCAPYAGDQVGFYAIPPIGAVVWIEFEGGDPTYPIWSGCFWQTGQVPTEVGTNADDPSQVKVFKTRVATLWINDTDKQGQITLKFNDPTVSEPVTITMVWDSTGITITVQGSNGTSTITQTPEDITTNSTTLGTTTSKDTTVTAQGGVTVKATNDIAMTSDSGKISGTASASSITFSSQSFSVSATNSASISGTSSVSISGTSSVSISASAGSLTASGLSTTVSSTGATKVSGTASLSLGGASISFLPG